MEILTEVCGYCEHDLPACVCDAECYECGRHYPSGAEGAHPDRPVCPACHRPKGRWPSQGGTLIPAGHPAVEALAEGAHPIPTADYSKTERRFMCLDEMSEFGEEQWEALRRLVSNPERQRHNALSLPARYGMGPERFLAQFGATKPQPDAMALLDRVPRLRRALAEYRVDRSASKARKVADLLLGLDTA